MTYIGQSVKRVEDRRFTTGNGKYTDDIVLPGMTYGYILRSPYAHAKILSIHTDARQSSGRSRGNFYWRRRKRCGWCPVWMAGKF